MNIPPKCEDLHLKIAELERREAALKNELDRTKKAYEAYGIDFDRSEEKASALQQCLIVAEQRAGELEVLLREVASLDPQGEFLGWKLDGKIYAALKPAAYGLAENSMLNKNEEV